MAAKDDVQDGGLGAGLESVWWDVRYAVRTLCKSPAFSTVAVVTLALAIGATTAIYSLLETVLFKSLPVKDPEQLVLVGGSQYPVFQAYRQHTGTFVDLCATSGVTPLDVEVENGARETTAVSLVSGSYFSTLGVQAAVGRVFTAADDRTPGDHPVAVASHGYWQRRFAGDAATIDRVIRVSGTPITIVGVAPPGFFGEQPGVAPDLWIPLTMWGQIVPGRNLLQSPGTGWLRIIGRVRPGVATSVVHPELTATFRDVVSGIFGPRMPDDIRRDTASATIRLEPVGRGLANLRAQFGRPLQLLMSAVVLVVLIACANIANLLLVRAAARRREIDVRVALGMSRSRLVRQLLTESLVLAAAGGALGVGFAWLGREALLRLISADGSRLPVAVATDARLILFVALLSTATALLFGLVPAWHSARASIVPSLVARREAGGGPKQRVSALLVIAQVSVSLVLLMGAGLFLRTIANLREVDLGFSPRQLLVLDVNPQRAGYQGDRAIALTRRLLDRINGLPGVTSVSLAENGLLMGRDSSTNLMHPEGFVAGPEGFPRMQWDVVGPRYFATIGAPLVAGREFDERDSVGAPNVVAINEDAARVFFADANPIGRRLVWGTGGQSLEIVAVIRNVKHTGPRDGTQLRFYLPYLQLASVRPNWVLASIRFLVRTGADPTTVAPGLRQLIVAEDPRLSAASLDSGTDLVGRALVRERMVTILLVAFGVLAVGLACLGLYGLIAYHVVQRTSEIGIRMALGAQRGDVVWVIVRRAVMWIAAGIALGVPLAISASGVARTLLFGLSATDPGTLVGAAVVLAAVGVMAAYIPAHRASRVDPLVALRTE